MMKKATDLVAGDRFVYVSTVSKKRYVLTCTSAFVHPRDVTHEVTVFTDAIGVLAAICVPQNDLVEIV